MKQLIITIWILMQVSRVFAQQEKRYINNGNKLYQQQKFKEAEEDYRKSVEKKNQNVEGNFNLGDALYKQKKYTEAGQQFNQLASTGTNKALAAKAYHNLGNSMLENKKIQEGIDAYKKALINNPTDDETRYNLAYAQEKLKQQQKQDKKDQQNKNNKDKNKDQQKHDNKDPKTDKDKKNQEKPNQDQNKKDEQNGQKPQPDKLSKDDAERMLDALNNDEKQTQEKLKNKKLKGERLHIAKDW